MEHIITSFAYVQKGIMIAGILVIFIGILMALWQFFQLLMARELSDHNKTLNVIRLRLGRVLILGLEFIVAADLIGTITTPDYYSLGILAIIVVIRTVLSYTINKEIKELSGDEAPVR